MADMETEEEDSQEDSFVVGQQNVQLGEAETLERVRNLFVLRFLWIQWILLPTLSQFNGRSSETFAYLVCES